MTTITNKNRRLQLPLKLGIEVKRLPSTANDLKDLMLKIQSGRLESCNVEKFKMSRVVVKEILQISSGSWVISFPVKLLFKE